MSIKSNEFSAAVGAILNDFEEDVQEAVAQAVEETGKQALKTVKARSPFRRGKKGGKYKKGWKMKKERSGVFKTQSRVTIYNAKRGWNTQLLENGHQKADGGRVEGIPHVRPAYEQAQQLLPELTAKAIEEANGQ